MSGRDREQLRREHVAEARRDLADEHELEQLYAALEDTAPIGRTRWSARRCAYCGDQGRLLVGHGVVVCPSHRELVRVDPTYALRSDYGVASAPRSEARAAPRSAVTRNDRLGA